MLELRIRSKSLTEFVELLSLPRNASGSPGIAVFVSAATSELLLTSTPGSLGVPTQRR